MICMFYGILTEHFRAHFITYIIVSELWKMVKIIFGKSFLSNVLSVDVNLLFACI